MNRSLLTCLLAAAIATPAAFHDTSSTNDRQTHEVITGTFQAFGSGTELHDVKPGKSKKYKKKMNKQMKKRKPRH